MVNSIYKKIGFIGSGKVATNLAKEFKSKGVSVSQIFSKNLTNATRLANIVGAKPINALEDFNEDLDLIIISINDISLSIIDIDKIPPKILICHTSGSVNINVFNSRKNYGVFYPLQTFSEQSKVNFLEIPICIEANTNENLEKIKTIAHILSNKVYEIGSEKRQKLHLASVFACNFTNMMYTIAEDILKDSQIDFSLILPLINETSKKIQNNLPSEVQTGPAVRSDFNIINKHILELEKYPDYQQIYLEISKLISKKYNKK